VTRRNARRSSLFACGHRQRCRLRLREARDPDVVGVHHHDSSWQPRLVTRGSRASIAEPRSVGGLPPHRPPSIARDEGALRVQPFDPSAGYPQTSKRILTVFHGVLHPTTLAEAGSDLHRACLTRLCCAFRFSRPLDALFRLQPFQPCFMPVTPLGFRFQRFSLPGSGSASRRSLPFVPLSSTGFGVGQDVSFPSPDFKGLRIQGIRTRQAGVTRLLLADPLVAFWWCPSGVYPTRPWPRASTKPPLMGFHTTPNGFPLVAVFALQSFKEP
jgi:hypothetical protein